MELILLEKIQNLGTLGDKVAVRPGYGRNYLIPKGMAVQASADNLARFEQRRAELEQAQADGLAAAQARADVLREVRVSIARKAGEGGRLFGSVGTTDIAEAVTAAGFELHKHEVRLPEGPLRQAGEYDVVLHLHTDVDATVKVEVVPEG
jgi:large subunit ribosomal protein L9